MAMIMTMTMNLIMTMTVGNKWPAWHIETFLCTESATLAVTTQVVVISTT